MSWLMDSSRADPDIQLLLHLDLVLEKIFLDSL